MPNILIYLFKYFLLRRLFRRRSRICLDFRCVIEFGQFPVDSLLISQVVYLDVQRSIGIENIVVFCEDFFSS